MEVVNCMEQFVKERIDDIYEKNNKTGTFCACAKCRADAMGLALNELKPKYVSTERGDMFTRLNLYKKENEMEIMCAVAKAMDTVKNNPKH